ncbi:hypothetical protein LPJ71_010734, partial [Coemansia sp. S17]
MTQVMSTLANVDWKRMATYTVNNPKQAFINAAIAYILFRQTLKMVKKVSIYGLRSTLSVLWKQIAGVLVRHIRRAPGTGIVVQRNISKI